VKEKADKLIKKVTELNQLTPSLRTAIKNCTTLEELELLAAPVIYIFVNNIICSTVEAC
jgi:hypothetical protein